MVCGPKFRFERICRRVASPLLLLRAPLSPPALRLAHAIRAGGHGTTLKKLNSTHEGSDPIPQNSTYFQGARVTTRVSSRRFTVMAGRALHCAWPRDERSSSSVCRVQSKASWTRSAQAKVLLRLRHHESAT